jgi:Lon protease-like protein
MQPNAPAPQPLDATGPLADLPLFPLSTVLLPGGVLDLQIFEVRYLDMIGKCHKNGTPFGVVALRKGSEVRRMDAAAAGAEGFAPEHFADVGTLATIAEFAAPQAGLMVVRCQGGARFRIRARSQRKYGLWVADVDTLACDHSTPVPPDLLPLADALARVLEQQRVNGPPQAAAPLPYHLDDCGWVANRWCDLLAMPLDVKQNLMQLDNPLLRLELVGDMLGKHIQAVGR